MGYRTIKETDLEATMRDGTVLRSDVYRPDTEDEFPVLLCRTPYDKAAEKQLEIGPKLAERGYILLAGGVIDTLSHETWAAWRDIFQEARE